MSQAHSRCVRCLLCAAFFLGARAPAHAGDLAAEAEHHLAKGKQALSEADYPTAIAHFKSAVALAPSKPASHLMLGLALSASNDCASAIPELEQYLKLQTTDLHPEARRTLDGCRARAAPPSVPAPAPVPVSPSRSAMAEKPATWIQLTGPASDPKKQRRCEQVAWSSGWDLHRLSVVEATLWLSKDRNELTVFANGRPVARRVLGREGMEELCAQAIEELARQLSIVHPTARLRPAPPPAAVVPQPGPRTTPPDEHDFALAIAGNRKLLDDCRHAYAPDTRELLLQVTITRAGIPSTVELPGSDGSSAFANCVLRIARQVRLAPFVGAEPTLRPTIFFTAQQ